ncbi:hypothetical protein B5X24_HaOG200903 [Helicoverpa armigera]|nr:hypothetical protein B5X24_HaOG200903 [Helicoverpa armigera]
MEATSVFGFHRSVLLSANSITMAFVKPETLFQVIMVFRAILGIYHKISPNKLINAFLRVYCVIVAIVVHLGTIYIMQFFNLTEVHLIILNLFYSVDAVMGLCLDIDYLKGFLQKVRNMDTEHFEMKLKAPVTVFFIFYILIARFYCHTKFRYDNGESFFSPLFSEASLGLIFDLVRYSSIWIRILMFELLWHQMAMLRKHFKTELSVARRFEEGDHMREKLRSCMTSYKNLLNASHKFDPVVKTQVRV